MIIFAAVLNWIAISFYKIVFIRFTKTYVSYQKNVVVCKCQYKNVRKVENKNVHFLYSSDCVSRKARFSFRRYDGPLMEMICE